MKPLIWIESVIEKHSHSRIEYMIKVWSLRACVCLLWPHYICLLLMAKVMSFVLTLLCSCSFCWVLVFQNLFRFITTLVLQPVYRRWSIVFKLGLSGFHLRQRVSLKGVPLPTTWRSTFQCQRMPTHPNLKLQWAVWSGCLRIVRLSGQSSPSLWVKIMTHWYYYYYYY